MQMIQLAVPSVAISQHIWPSIMYCVYTLLVLLLPILCPVPESSGGRYLIRQGDINIGSHVNTIFRLRCRSSAPLGSPHEMQDLMQDPRHTTYFGIFVHTVLLW